MKARGRPAGLTRQALRQVFEDLGGQPLTWRAMARHAQVGYAAARVLADNMARAGELQVLDMRREPGANRPMRLYVPAAEQAAPDGSGPRGNGLELTRCWQLYR